MLKDLDIKYNYALKTYIFTLIDSNYDSPKQLGEFNSPSYKSIMSSIINHYSSQNNIIQNIMIMMGIIYDADNTFNFEKQLKYYSDFIPEFKQYAHQVQKYLNLI